MQAKPLYRKILPTPDNSFTVSEFKIPYFDVPWHLHPEYEIILVRKSKGTRYVGDSIEPFFEGDIALLGAHLPHCWLNAPLEKCAKKDFGTHYIVLQFRYDFLGNHFFDIPEMGQIKEMLNSAMQGILFEGPEKSKLEQAIMELTQLEPVNRLLKFLELLKKMSHYPQTRLLSSPGFVKAHQSTRDPLSDKVHRYVMGNFKRNISLEEMGNLTNLTPTSFCRYFKRIMKKTFFTYLKEFRIGYACKLLIETDLSVAQIGYESGYNNLSLFHKQFKAIKKITPSAFRQAKK